MTTFLYRTKDNSKPGRKPRVYFTCHPEDFSKYFEKIREDIFKTHDCAIFYTDNMTEEIEEKYLESDLGQINLFVIPITRKLLTEPNRAMDSDFLFAKRKKIPILPIMFESDLYDIYSKPDKFGDIQYLEPYVNDRTAINYSEKLKKYLESVLISKEMATRVRKAFDAYIFLSYRKKDRHYANKLMKLIHNHDEFRNIAVWYDEFLTPGESFRENIKQMMKDSKLFTLLVTPNLLEYIDGKPNYVMAHEYPDAKKAGMSILPTEMEDTDKVALRNKYEDIPECINPQEDAVFKKRLTEALSEIAIPGNNNDPEHNYLIGLAYLDGIDVEKNAEMGIELITLAAESDFPEAMYKLSYIYKTGDGANIDINKAMKWAKKAYVHYKNLHGETSRVTLSAHRNLAYIYSERNFHKTAFELYSQIYEIHSHTYGISDPDTLTALSDLAEAYCKIGEYEKAFDLKQEALERSYIILGEDHVDTMAALFDLADFYQSIKNYSKALELFEKLYNLQCKNIGENNPNTLETLKTLALIHYKLHNYREALRLYEKCYDIMSALSDDIIVPINDLIDIYTEIDDYDNALKWMTLSYEHDLTIYHEDDIEMTYSMLQLADIYLKLKKYEKAAEFQEKSYTIICKIYGEGTKDTLITLSALANTYKLLGDKQKALELFEKLFVFQCRIYYDAYPETLENLSELNPVYNGLRYYDYCKFPELKYFLYRKVLGKSHPDTLFLMEQLLDFYLKIDDYDKTLNLFTEAYGILFSIHGNEIPYILSTFRNILENFAFPSSDYYNEMAKLIELLYVLRCSYLGNEHPYTMTSLADLATAYIKAELPLFALDKYKKLYEMQCLQLGAEHPQTLSVLSNLAYTYYQIYDYQEAYNTQEKVYTVYLKIFGEDHPKTKKARSSLLKIIKKINS